MSAHVDPVLLARFVAGELGDHAAAQVALHLDDCSACANLAREADPLARAFASVDDPDVPAGLVQAVLRADAARAAAAPQRLVDLGLAATLVGSALTLSALAAGPLGSAARLRVVFDLVAHGMAGPWVVLVLVGLAPALVLLTRPPVRARAVPA